jgi:hypothetical protein
MRPAKGGVRQIVAAAVCEPTAEAQIFGDTRSVAGTLEFASLPPLLRVRGYGAPPAHGKNEVCLQPTEREALAPVRENGMKPLACARRSKSRDAKKMA